MENPFTVLSLVASVLEQQRIAYVLVGSLASSTHGMYRSTADIDIVADVHSEQVIPLLTALQENFDVDEHAVHEAIDRRPNTQWTDVVGIIGGSSSILDLYHLRDWAKTLCLTELLDQAFREASDEESVSSGE